MDVFVNKIILSDESLIDSFGSVFFYDNRVFRAIQPRFKNSCLELLQSSLIKELESKNLIPHTVVSNIDFGRNDLVLEHERLLDTKPFEWSFNMLKDAALTTLLIREICNKHGYDLKDAHPNNILFRGAAPVFIDFGSIVPGDRQNENWVANDEFIKTFYIPLNLWQNNELFLSRVLLEYDSYPRILPNQRLEESSYLKIEFEKHIRRYLSLNNHTLEFKTTDRFYKLSDFLVRGINKAYKIATSSTNKPLKYYSKTKIVSKQEIQNLNPLEVRTSWDSYHDEFLGPNNTPSRFTKLIDLIRIHCPDITDVIDLAGNKGAFSICLNNELSLNRIILADYDSQAIDGAYSIIKETRNTINPVLLNFMVPVNLDSTIKRFKCDLAVALAVTHHLILSQQFTLTAIFDRVSRYTRKYVIIEFMPLGLWSDKFDKPVSVPDWYTVDWFKKHFLEFFHLLDEQHIDKNRIAFIGKIRNA